MRTVNGHTTSAVGPAVLEYTLRRVIGPGIPMEKARFDPKKREVVKEVALVEKPVIVFFPNGTTQVMASKDAEMRGFFQTPQILNIEAVEDNKSAAGRYKNAFRQQDRVEAWLMLEQALISSCISRTGHPLPLDNNYEDKSVFVDDEGVVA